MRKLAKVLLALSGLFLIVDGVYIILDKPNFINADWGLPCPIVLIMLGLGLVLDILSGLCSKQ